MEAPLYQCHKKVRALKIKEISVDAVDAIITPDGDYGIFIVQSEWVSKHGAEAGGYFVMYEDGYKSFSPAAAFEDGYTLDEETGKPAQLSEYSRMEAVKLAMGSIYRGLYGSYEEFESDLDKFARYLRTGRTTAPAESPKE